MKSTRLSFFLLTALISSSVASTDCDDTIPESLQPQCNANDNDSECLSKLLQQTSQGIPYYDIERIDPLYIHEVQVPFNSDNIFYRNRDITVLGLKDQKILDFRIDPTTKTVILKWSAELAILSNITVIFTQSWVSVAGLYWANGSVLGTAICGYELGTDDDGVTHIALGPEIVSCEEVHTRSVIFSPELELGCATVPEANKLHSNVTKREVMRERTVGAIAEKAYATVFHNIRAAANVLPASALFKSLQSTKSIHLKK